MQLKQILFAGAAALMLGIPRASGQTPRPLQQQQADKMISFLGVGLQEITSARAKELKLPDEVGVEIIVVQPDSPASAAGLKVGDVVLQYNGQRVEGTEQFKRLVQETPAGREVKLQIFRGGNLQSIAAKIGSYPAPPAQWSQGLPQGSLVLPIQPPRSQQAPAPGFAPFLGQGEPAILGIQGLPVEGQLADYFGVKQGVLVSSVAQGSAAEKAGIKAGDVITRVGDAKVATPAEISSRIRTTRGRSFSIALMRDHKEMTVTATLDDRF